MSLRRKTPRNGEKKDRTKVLDSLTSHLKELELDDNKELLKCLKHGIV